MNPFAFIRDYIRYRSASSIPVPLMSIYPAGAGGRIDRHYFHQDCWAIRKVLANGENVHVDFGSRVDGFVGQLAAAGKRVFMYDIRPPEKRIPGMSTLRCDLTDLRFRIPNGSLRSVSCLHVLEHVGLGRYGDALDPFGMGKAIIALRNVVAPGGHLYVSVPIGRERVCFNAHRILNAERFQMCFESMFDVEEFCAIDDCGEFREMVTPDCFSDSRYSLGMWHFRRKA